jgi:hypothetical protein
MWKTLQPFSVVAVRHPCSKIMCKVFKVGQEDYLVDVRLSTCSGFGGVDCATEVLLKLQELALPSHR